jgi:PAS domain S-box-containing protein
MNIQNKFILILLLVVLLLTFSMDSYTSHKTRLTLTNTIHSKIAQYLLPRISDTADNFKMERIKNLNDQFSLLLTQGGLLYVSGMNLKGEVLARSVGDINLATNENETDNPLFQQALKELQPVEHYLYQAASPEVDVWAPVMEKGGNQPVGILRFGLPLAEDIQTQKSFVSDVTGRFFIVLALAGLLLLLYLRHLLKPVELLKNATHRLSDGDWGVTVPITSHDELGKLTETFNTMSLELRDTAGFLEAIIHQMVDALIVTRPDGSLRIMNPAALKLSGYLLKEINGKPLQTLFPEDLREHFTHRHFEEVFGPNNAHDLEAVFLRKNGDRVPVSLSGSLLRDKEGQITGLVVLARDITELKKWEKGILEAREAALESARLKSEFLANMSHEIRTPMNAIIGMTGLLLDTSLQPEQADYAETIRKSGDSLLGLINDILDFSKIEAGKMEIEETDFKLRLLLEEVMELLAESAHDKDLELNYWIEKGIPENVKGDPTRLRQILTNLMGNALKFTEKGEVNVWVEPVGVPTAPGELYLRFNVKDTGTGVPADRLDRLFKSFSQVDGSNTRKYGGTGLGLAISKQLAELMGGTIGVESELGVGSRFWFTVKLGQGTQDLEQPIAREDLKDLRVLIVDDNATNRKILMLQTQSWQMTGVEVPGGAEALEALRKAFQEKQPFQLALLDMQMPGMDGLDLTRQIKADPSIAGTRLVMLTSMGHPGHVWAAREAGVTAYLTKPVKQSQLYDCLLNVMSGVATPSQAAVPDENAVPAFFDPASSHILLVEDNVVNQKVAGMQLKKLGFEPDLASNGLEAVEAVSKKTYNLVLMDCQMPQMDGFEATHEIRKMENGTHLHTTIVAMTANAMRGDKEHCLQAGMDDYISKPVHMKELTQVLQRWISPMAGPLTIIPPVERRLASPPEPSKSVTSAGTLSNPSAFVIPPEATDQPWVSAEALERLKSLDADGEGFLKEIIHLFLEDTPPRLVNLRQAVIKQDFNQMEHEAHTLKGSTGNLGALRMRVTSIALVSMARASTTEGALTLVDRIESDYVQTVKELQPYLNP